jgi:putative transposase
MPTRDFSELFVHVVWKTKGAQPIIIPDVEALLHDFLQARCKATPGVVFHGVGGTPDHVHLVVEFEPHVALAAVVDDLMSASAAEVQLDNGQKAVEWQSGYGVVSFGRKNLPWVLGYVAKQKELHAAGKAEPRLENTGEAPA